jgi:hypothetical protein
MRVLTHYELSILIENEIKLMCKNLGSININYARARAEDIIKYCNEYDALTDSKI